MPFTEDGGRGLTPRDNRGPVPLAECALILRPEDDVAVTVRDLPAGTRVLHAERELVLPGDVPHSHKLALRDLAAGSVVRRYGQSIGRATVDIAAGAHVHTHNLDMDHTDRA